MLYDFLYNYTNAVTYMRDVVCHLFLIGISI